MWFTLKLVVFLALLGAGAYAAVTVDLGGKTFVQHTREVWQAPVVQEKVELARTGVQRSVEQQLNKVSAEAARQAKRQVLNGEPEHYAEEDRQALNDLLKSVK